MVKPEKFDHLYLVYHFTVPLSMYHLFCNNNISLTQLLSELRFKVVQICSNSDNNKINNDSLPNVVYSL